MHERFNIFLINFFWELLNLFDCKFKIMLLSEIKENKFFNFLLKIFY